MTQGKNKENTSRSNSLRSESHEENKSDSKISEIINVRDPDMIIFAIAQVPYPKIDVLIVNRK